MQPRLALSLYSSCLSHMSAENMQCVWVTFSSFSAWTVSIFGISEGHFLSWLTSHQPLQPSSHRGLPFLLVWSLQPSRSKCPTKMVWCMPWPSQCPSHPRISAQHPCPLLPRISIPGTEPLQDFPAPMEPALQCASPLTDHFSLCVCSWRVCLNAYGYTHRCVWLLTDRCLPPSLSILIKAKYATEPGAPWLQIV